MPDPADYPRWALSWRNIVAPCVKCQGRGGVTYKSRAAWRETPRHHRIHRAPTYAVCDQCWGSGDRDRRWANLREMEAHASDLQSEIHLLQRRIEALKGS